MLVAPLQLSLPLPPPSQVQLSVGQVGANARPGERETNGRTRCAARLWHVLNDENTSDRPTLQPSRGLLRLGCNVGRQRCGHSSGRHLLGAALYFECVDSDFRSEQT